MTSENRWRFPENDEDLFAIFNAAKQGSPQLVFDAEGVFTVSYKKDSDIGSAQDFLLKGSRESE